MAQNRVVIAGAGPVGCVSALSLAKAGIPVTILEAGEDLELDLRASTFHPPTLDMLDQLGVANELIEQGLVCPRWQYRDTKEGIIADWNLGLLNNYTRHPFRLQAEQFRLTQIIMKRLKAMSNVEVRFGCRVTDTKQDGNGVTVRFDSDEGADSLRGTYLIAAEGGSSPTRKTQGIAFDGLTFPEMWLIVSTPFDFTQHFEELTPIAYVTEPDDWFVFVFVSGLWRVLVPTKPGDTPEAILEDDYLQARLQKICATGQNYEIAHKTAYSVHQRVAETYVHGRIFLAGDAAHINNPLGGMGMNGGIHDAINLCEKIIKVWSGQAGDGRAEFARYDAQRRPIAHEYVQRSTLQNKQMLEEQDPATRKKRHDDLRRTASDPDAAREFLMNSSMIRALEKAAVLG